MRLLYGERELALMNSFSNCLIRAGLVQFDRV